MAVLLSRRKKKKTVSERKKRLAQGTYIVGDGAGIKSTASLKVHFSPSFIVAFLKIAKKKNVCLEKLQRMKLRLSKNLNYLQSVCTDAKIFSDLKSTGLLCLRMMLS